VLPDDVLDLKSHGTHFNAQRFCLVGTGNNTPVIVAQHDNGLTVK
jgi:hypothetical protein